MRKILMATVVLPLALGQAGVALAQSAQDSQRNAKQQSGDVGTVLHDPAASG